jgi:hypothetical protein
VTRYIGVVGPAVCDAETAKVAREVGHGVAEAGGVVVCGGLGGVMEAACRGAADAAGTSVGILPGADRADANPHVTVALPTGLGEARNALVVRACDAVIAVGGEFGTLSEIALALKLGIRVIGINTWELARRGSPVDAIERAPDAATAVRLAMREA